MNILFTALRGSLLPAAEKLSPGEVVAITFTGLAVVFLGLIILIVFLTIMGAIFKRQKPVVKQTIPPAPAAAPAPAPAPAAAIVDEDEETVAAITAAIAMMGEADGTGYAIQSIRRSKNAGSGRPAWAMAGIRDNTTPF